MIGRLDFEHASGDEMPLRGEELVHVVPVDWRAAIESIDGIRSVPGEQHDPLVVTV